MLAILHGMPTFDPVAELRLGTTATEVAFGGPELSGPACAQFKGAGKAAGKAREVLRRCLLQELERGRLRGGSGGASTTRREYESGGSAWVLHFSHLDRGLHARAPRPRDERLEKVTRWSIAGAKKTLASQLPTAMMLDPPASTPDIVSLVVCLDASGTLDSCHVSATGSAASESVLAEGCSRSKSWTPHEEGGIAVACCAEFSVSLRLQPVPR